MSEQKKKPSLAGIGNFLKEAKSELKKIVWASPKQIINNSILVLGAIIVAGLAVSLIDFLFTSGVQGIINLLKK
jgi:preprotein translocase subunit SecE